MLILRSARFHGFESSQNTWLVKLSKELFGVIWWLVYLGYAVFL